MVVELVRILVGVAVPEHGLPLGRGLLQANDVGVSGTDGLHRLRVVFVPGLDVVALEDVVGHTGRGVTGLERSFTTTDHRDTHAHTQEHASKRKHRERESVTCHRLEANATSSFADVFELARAAYCRRIMVKTLRALSLAFLACASCLSGCASSDPAAESSATKGFVVIYADQPPTGAQVSVDGQLRGTLSASYSNGAPGCFGPDQISAPEGTVVLTVFKGHTYAIDVQYPNGTQDHLDLEATASVIEAFCYKIGTHPN